MTAHDCRDRRHTKMQSALDALDGCRADLLAFSGDPKIAAGVGYAVADRIGRLMAELETFKARDLLNARTP